MEASGAFAGDRQKDLDVEFAALEGSLSMMSKGIPSSFSLRDSYLPWKLVLNDVLDLLVQSSNWIHI